MRVRNVAVFVLAFVVGSGLSGCARSQAQRGAELPSPPQAEVRPVRELAAELPVWQGTEYTDIPVPSGFNIIVSDSFTHSTKDGFRLSELKYTGEMEIPDVIRFYQERMPGNGWRFSQIIGLADKTLTYDKGSEECMIMLKARGDKTIVMIMVHPVL